MVVSKEEGQKWAPIAKAQLKKQVKMYQADVRKQAAGAKKAEEAAKKKLLEFFDLLGFNDPNVVEARKKLSSMMFK